MNSYYALRVWPGEPDKIHPSLDIYLNGGDLHISPSLHLCSNSSMAVLADADLAEQFRAYCESRIQQRYGLDSKIEVQRIPAPGTPTRLRKLLSRIIRDTTKIRERLFSEAA